MSEKLQMVIVIITLLIMILLLVLFPPRSHGDDFDYNATFSYHPANQLYQIDLDAIYSFDVAFLDCHVYGGATTVCTHKANPPAKLQYQPQLNIYSIGMSIGYGLCEIGWEHFCIHPGDFKDSIIYTYSDLYLQSSDRIYFKVDSRRMK